MLIRYHTLKYIIEILLLLQISVYVICVKLVDVEQGNGWTTLVEGFVRALVMRLTLLLKHRLLLIIAGVDLDGVWSVTKDG